MGLLETFEYFLKVETKRTLFDVNILMIMFSDRSKPKSFCSQRMQSSTRNTGANPEVSGRRRLPSQGQHCTRTGTKISEGYLLRV